MRLAYSIRRSFLVASTVFAALLITACATSPLGRSQLVLFPEAEMTQMGLSAYQEMKQQTPASGNSVTNQYVQCVSDYIVRAMPNGNPADWEVTVFDDGQANAFALPGGKIGVYTGLLDVAENQDQLATVIGHEVAHVLARHSNERVSTSFVTNTGLQAVQVAAGSSSPMKQQLFGLLGLGAQVGVTLPFGRKQESEADLLGLDLMANAGFDPRASVQLWQNMAKASGGQKPPEFMSTHPSNERRIISLNERIPSAMKLSLAARQSGTTPDCR